MGFPIDHRHGLVLRFADFQLLPEMLRMVRGQSRPEVLDAWTEYLVHAECSTDHIDDETEGSPRGLAEDVWRLTEGLELVSHEGLTDSGVSLVELADSPPDWDEKPTYQSMRRVLANQIKTCYFSSGFSVVGNMQNEAKLLIGIQPCPGLLLVEVQFLIEDAHRSRGDSWPTINLASNRESALEQYDGPAVDLDNLQEILGTDGAVGYSNQVTLADALAEYYANKVDLSLMKMSELRATTMLLCFAGFFEIPDPSGPVQYLVNSRA